MKQSKKTFKQVHAEIKNLPTEKRNKVLEILGASSDQTFYDLMQGRKKLSPAEKIAIAAIYEKNADEINWLDDAKEKVIA